MTPQFESLAELAHMNGHGAYVWAAFAVGLVVMAAMLIAPLVQQRAFIRRQYRRQQLEAQSGRKSSEDGSGY